MKTRGTTFLPPHRMRRRRTSCGARPLAELLEQRVLFSVLSTQSFIYLNYPQQTPSDFVSWHENALWTVHNNVITRLTGGGVLTAFTLPAAPGATREVTSNLTFTQDGTAWFIVRDSNVATPGTRIEGLTVTGGGAQFFDATDISAKSIWNLVAAPDDSLWFTQGDNTIGHVVGGQTSLVTVGQAAGFAGLTVAGDGAIWFSADGAAGNGNVAGRIAPEGEGGGTLAVQSLSYRPADLVQGADGAMYIGGNNALTRIAADGTVTSISLPAVTAVNLTAAADGSIWFIDRASTLNPIARWSADGGVRHFASTGTAGNRLQSITMNADGVLIALDSNGDLTRVDTTNGLAAQAVQVNATFRKNWDFVVGSFDDANGGSAGDYTATIDWGDGQTSAAMVVDKGGGHFEISGGHAFTAWGWRVVGVHVADSRTFFAPRTLDFHSVAYVIPPGMAGQGTQVQAVAGETFSGAVATYAGVDFDTLANYQAWISWGDGETTAGTLVAGQNGAVMVAGNHAYLRDGGFATNVRVVQKASTQLPGYWAGSSYGWVVVQDYAEGGTAVGHATVRAGRMTGTPTYIYPIVEGLEIPLNLATFVYGGTAEDIGHLHARVDWGDRNISDGTITAADGADGGGFAVRATSHYVREGDYAATVNISDDRVGPENVGTVVAGIRVWPHLMMSHPVWATSGPAFSGAVITVTDPGVENWASNMTATIAWGDGTTSAGTLEDQGGGVYVVQGTHAYTAVPWHATYRVDVTVNESRTAPDGTGPAMHYSAWGGGFIQVTEQAVDELTARNVRVSPYVFTGDWTVGVGGMALPAGLTAADVTGTVAWQDGTTSAITVDGTMPYDTNSVAPGWRYALLTARNFSAAGTYHGGASVTAGGVTLTFAVSQEVRERYVEQTGPSYNGTVDGPGGQVSTQGSLDVAHNSIVIDTAGAANDVTVDNGTVSGTFARFKDLDAAAPNTVVEYVALIDWGDGQTSDATVTANADGGFDVTAAHTYTADGDFAMHVIVRRNVRNLPSVPGEMIYDFARRDLGYWSGNLIYAAGFVDGLSVNNAVSSSVVTSIGSPLPVSTQVDTATPGGRRVIHIGHGPIDVPAPTTGDGGVTNTPPVVLTPVPGSGQVFTTVSAGGSFLGANVSSQVEPGGSFLVQSPAGVAMSTALHAAGAGENHALPAADADPAAPQTRDPATFEGEFKIDDAAPQPQETQPLPTPAGDLLEDEGSAILLRRLYERADEDAGTALAAVAVPHFLVVGAKEEAQPASTNASVFSPARWWKALVVAAAVAVHVRPMRRRRVRVVEIDTRE